MIIDFHTHANGRHDAVQSVTPDAFAPREGLRYSVGWHPWALPPLDDVHRGLLRRAAAHSQVVAVGETGIDRLRGGDIALQQAWLAEHVRLADDLRKPVVVHLVRGSQELIKLWRDTGPHRVPLIVHGFRGSQHVARPLLAQGFYLSYGARYNTAALGITPPDRLLLETDDLRDTAIDEVAAEVAAALNTSTEQIMTTVAANTLRLLKC